MPRRCRNVDAVADPSLLNVAEIRAAAARLEGRIRRTPIVPTSLGTSASPLLLKAECLQVTGSFKARGAGNAIALLGQRARERGVVTHSSGNHAQALARAAREAGIRATVVMPRETPAVKRHATEGYGAEVVLVDAAERASTVARIQEQTGAEFVPPFDDERVIAGQGTVGLELIEQVPDLASVWVPVSGGGLISGIAVAVKALVPHVRIIGVEPELAGDLAEGFATGVRTSWPVERTSRTLADGLRVGAVGERNWQHISALVDDVVTVDEEAIRATLRDVILGCKLVSEPSGAVSVAGARHHHSVGGRGTAVAIVSGGNIDPALLAEVVSPQRHGVPTDRTDEDL